MLVFNNTFLFFIALFLAALDVRYARKTRKKLLVCRAQTSHR